MNIGNLKNRRIIGLPIEFATVVVISAMLVIYTSGWIAASGIENRVDSNSPAMRLMKYPRETGIREFPGKVPVAAH